MRTGDLHGLHPAGVAAAHRHATRAARGSERYGPATNSDSKLYMLAVHRCIDNENSCIPGFFHDPSLHL